MKLFHAYTCYDDLWSVIFDITIVIVLGLHEPRSYEMASLIDKCVCVLTSLLAGCSPASLPFLGNPTVAFKCS